MVGDDARRGELDPRIQSPRVRLLARGIRRSLQVVGRGLGTHRAPRVWRAGTHASEVLARDAIGALKMVDQVDAHLDRRLGAAARLTVRAWVKPGALGLEAGPVEGHLGPGVVTGAKAERILEAPIAHLPQEDVPGPAAEAACVDARYEAARQLLSEVVKRAWGVAGGTRPAVYAVLVSTSRAHPWAMTTRALGGGEILEPGALKDQYGPAPGPTAR